MTEFPDPLPVRVDFAFGADPDTTPDEGQWTTVPDDHWISQSIAISRGRQNEEDQVQAASWSFQLLNDSGNYTPDLVTSPHYPHLKLGLPCRIRVGSMVRAVGNVAEITPEWPAGDIDPGHSIVRVTVGGFLRRLGQVAQPLNSALHRHFANHPGVIAYWPLEEESDATSASTPLRGVHPIQAPGVEFGATDGPAGSRSLARVLPGSTDLVGTVPAHPSTDRYMVQSVLLAPELTPGDRTGLTAWSSSSNAQRWRLWFSNSQVRLELLNSSDSTIVNATQAIHPNFAGQWLRLVLLLAQDGADIDYQATVVTATPDATILNNITGTATSRVLGRIVQAGGGGIAAGTPPERFRGHIAVSGGDVALMDDHVAFHGYTGERAAYRLERLCGEEQLTCTIIGDPDVSMPMGPQRPATFTEQLQEISDTDGGILAETREAFGFEYRTRVSMYNQEPALELDAGTFPGDITHPFTPTLDDQQIRNDVTAHQSGGSSARVTDEADIEDRGRFAGDLTVNVHGDSRLSLVASWRLHHGTYPGMRYPSISPALTQVPELISEWVTVELGDRIRAFGLPDEHPVDDVDLLVQGYVETLEPHGWHIEANASPARPWNVFELEHETFGRLWSPRAYLGEDINASATSFDVIVPVQRALNPAPDFESPITAGGTFDDWFTSSGTTLERDGAEVFQGRWSGRFTPAGFAPFIQTNTPTAVSLSQEYQASAWVMSPTGISVFIALLFRQLTGGGFQTRGRVDGSSVALAPGQWTRLVVRGDAIGSTPVAGSIHDTDTVTLRLEYATFNPDPTDILHIDDAEVGRPDAPFEVDTGLSTEIIIGGERMTVTAIGADDGTGAQTFTVTRSVNGITKSHVAGAPVRLWPGHVMGL